MENNQKYSEDEIDLIAIIAKTFKVLKKRMVLIIAFLILGILGGIGFFYLFKPTYLTQAVAQTRSINYLEVKGILMNLNTYLEEKNYDAIAKNLKINEEEAKLIKEIETQSISNLSENDVKDNNRRDSIFVVKVFINDQKMVPILQTKLFKYLNETPYVKRVNDTYSQQLKENLKRVQRDIKLLDSSKYYINKYLQDGQITNEVKIISLGGIYEQTSQLYTAENKLKQKILLGKEISIIDNFGEYDKPIRGLGKTIGIFTAIALVLVSLLIILLEVLLAVKKYQEKT